MALRILTGASASANHHVYINRADYQAVTVSTGLDNSRTFNIPVMSRDARLIFNGTFGSGSASTQVIVGVGPHDGAAFAALFTVSAPLTTTIPVQADTVVRFVHQWTSAAAAITNASVDLWMA